MGREDAKIRVKILEDERCKLLKELEELRDCRSAEIADTKAEAKVSSATLLINVFFAPADYSTSFHFHAQKQERSCAMPR